MNANRLFALILALVIAGLGGWLAMESMKGKESLAEAPFGVPFSLIDQNGQPITEAAFKTKPTALFFGFTHCPEVCPTTTYELTGWLNEIDPDKSRIQAYFVSIDPARDTPELLKTYLSNVGDRIIGISGDPAKVEAMARGFKVYFKKVLSDETKPEGDYTMDHTASVFLLDKGGRFVGTIAYQENPDVAKDKLKNLLTR